MCITNLCGTINWISVIVAAIVGFGLGSLWHNKIMFGKAWMEEHALKPNHAEGTNFPLVFALTFLQFIIIALGMEILMSAFLPDIQWFQGIAFGAFLSIFFVATTFGISFLFLKKSFKIWLIDAFYYIVSFVLMGWILAAWN